MPNAYTEDLVVEQPAVGFFAELGWRVAGTPSSVCVVGEACSGGLLGRDTKGEAVLAPRLRSALEKLNPSLPRETITAAIDALIRDRSAMLLEQANCEVYRLLMEGIPVSVPDRDRGGQKMERVRVIDWDNPANNDFLLVSQLSITGRLYACRPDLVGFINGLPLLVIELKKPGVPARTAFEENLTHYKREIPQLFHYNALLIASNGTDSRVGSITADWGRFFEWKRVEREDEPRRVSLETMVRGTCDKARLLDLIENFTLFSEAKSGLTKVIGQNHQFLGVNRAIEAALAARARGDCRGGVFWQTQGSGKSYSMVFLAQKVLRKHPGNWTFVVVTDRAELDVQIAKTFKACGAVSEAEGDLCHASSGAHLRELLRGNHRYVFTLIHKFQPDRDRAETPSSPALLPEGEGGVGTNYRGGLRFAGLLERARELRRNHTSAEDLVWELVRDRRFEGLKFRRQHQINNYIADFFCAEHRLVLELDGGIHRTPEVEEKDRVRDVMLHSLGFKVLRFQNQFVLDQTEAFLVEICSALGIPRSDPLPLGEGQGEGHGRMPVLCDRSDVIVLTDEAHRSQYDTLALNMRAALPNALFLAFTGTPLIAGEERTRDLFGDYVSVYDFQQSVEDGATVPLFYENRTPELQLTNPDLNEEIYSLIEQAQLDPEQEARLERELSRQYHILTRDDRLETIAKDIVRHFLGRGFVGKAMVVSIDKATALRMHDKVRAHWQAELESVRKELGGYTVTAARQLELKERLRILEETDMALIVSPGQNEIEQMKRLGLDIQPHRQRMNDANPGLDERFKSPGDPLRIVFVCAMWLTGFDAPSCSTVYLDKPMRNHTLMQTIARANRVFPGKHSGLIVDYANVFASLEQALAIYGAGSGGRTPVRDKALLVAELRAAIRAATEFFARRGVSVPAPPEAADDGRRLLDWVDYSVNRLISPDLLRGEFLGHVRTVTTLYKAVKPDPAALEFVDLVAAMETIAGAIRAKLNPEPADISQVMGDLLRVLDASVSGVDMVGPDGRLIDLSKIDFQALANRFRQSAHRNTDLEVLKSAIQRQIEKLISLNPTRRNYQDTFLELIESYNAGSRNIEQLFEELLKLSRGLSEEEQRHVRENLSEEELVIFDILTRPAPELSAEERAEVKMVARELLARMRDLLVINWRNKPTARAQVKIAIEDVLDGGLPRVYTPEVYREKCSALFQHVYERHPERLDDTQAG